MNFLQRLLEESSKLSFSGDEDDIELLISEIRKLDDSIDVVAPMGDEVDFLGVSETQKQKIKDVIKRLNLKLNELPTGNMNESKIHIAEALQGGKVNVFKVTPKDISDLKDDVFAIKNENAVVDFLVDLLGIPRDGTAYKIRTGFMAYDEKTKTLFFSKNKYDLPAFLGKRPVK